MGRLWPFFLIICFQNWFIRSFNWLPHQSGFFLRFSFVVIVIIIVITKSECIIQATGQTSHYAPALKNELFALLRMIFRRSRWFTCFARIRLPPVSWFMRRTRICFIRIRFPSVSWFIWRVRCIYIRIPPVNWFNCHCFIHTHVPEINRLLYTCVSLYSPHFHKYTLFASISLKPGQYMLTIFSLCGSVILFVCNLSYLSAWFTSVTPQSADFHDAFASFIYQSVDLCDVFASYTSISQQSADSWWEKC